MASSCEWCEVEKEAATLYPPSGHHRPWRRHKKAPACTWTGRRFGLVPASPFVHPVNVLQTFGTKTTRRHSRKDDDPHQNMFWIVDADAAPPPPDSEWDAESNYQDAQSIFFHDAQSILPEPSTSGSSSDSNNGNGDSASDDDVVPAAKSRAKSKAAVNGRRVSRFTEHTNPPRVPTPNPTPATPTPTPVMAASAYLRDTAPLATKEEAHELANLQREHQALQSDNTLLESAKSQLEGENAVLAEAVGTLKIEHDMPVADRITRLREENHKLKLVNLALREATTSLEDQHFSLENEVEDLSKPGKTAKAHRRCVVM